VTGAEPLHVLLPRAERLLASGNVPDAIRAYEELLAAYPDRPDGWYNLGYLLRCARRFEESLAAYAQALARGVDRPEDVRVNRAAILSEYLERADEAEAELKAALELDPGHLVAWLNLGTLYEDRGDPVSAGDAYRRASSIDPANGRALARLAAIDAFLGEVVGTPERLRAALDRPGLAADDRAELGFALGAALDATGRHDEAFAAFGQANRTARTSSASRYDRAAHEALVDALIGLRPPAPLDEAGSAMPRPLFICGLFRSGSTLTERVLARHPRVTAGGELETIPAMVRDRLQPYPRALSDASPALLRSLREAYLGEIGKLHPGAELVTDKRVDNFLHIGLIKTLFPAARIVHTVREPLDNVLSIYFLHFGTGVPYGFDLDDIVHWYGQYRRLMRHWRGLYGPDIHDSSYDALVAEPERAVRDLLDYCGLDWDPACLAADRSRGIVRTASSWLVRQPLHTRSSGRWRDYERHLGGVRAALAEWDQSLG
jgi:tetratricopeptide (TPR) repeat protein